MNNNLYLLLIGLCAGLAWLIGFSDDISNHKWIQNQFNLGKLNWFKSRSRLLFKIISYIILALLGVFLSISKEKFNDSESAKESKKQDSIAEKKRLESNKDIVKNFSEGLAKYYLKYDSVNQKVQRIIKDSIKTSKDNTVKPELNIQTTEAERVNDTIKYSVTFFCNTTGIV